MKSKYKPKYEWQKILYIYKKRKKINCDGKTCNSCIQNTLFQNYFFVSVKWPDKSTASYDMLDFESDIEYL